MKHRKLDKAAHFPAFINQCERYRFICASGDLGNLGGYPCLILVYQPYSCSLAVYVLSHGPAVSRGGRRAARLWQ